MKKYRFLLVMGIILKILAIIFLFSAQDILRYKSCLHVNISNGYILIPIQIFIPFLFGLILTMIYLYIRKGNNFYDIKNNVPITVTSVEESGKHYYLKIKIMNTVKDRPRLIKCSQKLFDYQIPLIGDYIKNNGKLIKFSEEEEIDAPLRENAKQEFIEINKKISEKFN